MSRLPIRMPQLGESAASATVVAWLAQVGDRVAVDEDLLEVQTEKSVLTVTSPAEGVLAEHQADSQDQCEVGDILGWLEVEGDLPAGAVVPTAVAEDMDAPTAADPGAHTRVDETAAIEDHSVSVGDAAKQGLHVPAKAQRGLGYMSPRVRARMTEIGLSNVDILGIRGTGGQGRVSVKDLERFISQLEQSRTSQASPMRVTVADSMVRSWSRPLATIAMPMDMEPILKHRRSVKGRPSTTVYALRALALALAEDDQLASRLIGDRMVHPERIDLSFAVEAADGVLTPVLRGVDGIALEPLREQYAEGLEAAQARNLGERFGGPSIATVNNFSNFGITWATPIPLPDQSLILGIGAMRNVPVWQPGAGTWGRGREAEVTLTFDHRVADGGAAGKLLRKVIELMQHPERV